MKTAILSECGTYRYRLTRGRGKLLPVVMLNPSTADASVDDATIRRLLGFAGRGLHIEAREGVFRREVYQGIDVVNLYAYRSTDPKALAGVADAYGPDNRDTHWRFCRDYGPEIVVAWGAHATPQAESRFFDVYDRHVGPRSLPLCFGTNKNGSPKHPLYLPNNAQLCPYFRR